MTVGGRAIGHGRHVDPAGPPAAMPQDAAERRLARDDAHQLDGGRLEAGSTTVGRPSSPAITGSSPTYFEQRFAAARVHFAHRGAHLVIRVAAMSSQRKSTSRPSRCSSASSCTARSGCGARAGAGCPSAGGSSAVRRCRQRFREPSGEQHRKKYLKARPMRSKSRHVRRSLLSVGRVGAAPASPSRRSNLTVWRRKRALRRLEADALKRVRRHGIVNRNVSLRPVQTSSAESSCYRFFAKTSLGSRMPHAQTDTRHRPLLLSTAVFASSRPLPHAPRQAPAAAPRRTRASLVPGTRAGAEHRRAQRRPAARLAGARALSRGQPLAPQAGGRRGAHRLHGRLDHRRVAAAALRPPVPGSALGGSRVSAARRRRRCSCASARTSSSSRPKAVVILAGTNDIAGNTGPMADEQIEGNLASMSELAPRTASRWSWPASHQSAPTTRRQRAAADHDAADGADQGRQRLDPEVRARARDVYLDYFSAMVDAERVLRAELSEDDLHPNAKGYEIMAPLAEAAIAKALK